MKKIEKALFVILVLNALSEIYSLYSQVGIFTMVSNQILDRNFHNIKYISETIMSVISIILLIIGLIICVKDGKFKMNNWIKIPVIYYTLTFVFWIPNYITQFFRPSIESFSFIDFILYDLNPAIMITLSCVYWNKKHMLSKTKFVSSKDIQIKTHKKLNCIAIIILLTLGLYILLICSDSPISWKIPEQFMLCLPVFYLIPLGLSVISLRINKNRTAIVTTVISTIFLIPTLLFTLFLINFKYNI